MRFSKRSKKIYLPKHSNVLRFCT